MPCVINVVFHILATLILYDKLTLTLTYFNEISRSFNSTVAVVKIFLLKF